MRRAGLLLVAGVLAAAVAAQAEPAAAPTAAPAASGPAAAAPAPVPPPGYPYPAPYGYPPPYAYPPSGYPAPYPAYPGYPPAYGVQQAYGRPVPPLAPPRPVPTGRWRLGAGAMLIPQGRFSYELRYRGESLLVYARDIQTTGGVSVSGEYDLIRYVYVGFAFQYLPTIEWTPAPGIARNPIRGKASAYDFLPFLGARYAVTPRLRLLAYAAPGFSIFDASGVEQYLSSSAVTYGFALQLGGGLLYAIGEHIYLSARGSYQWTAASNHAVSSSTTGEVAELHTRFRFVGAQASLGYWF